MLVDVAKTFDNYYPLSLTLLTIAGIEGPAERKQAAKAHWGSIARPQQG